MRSVLLYSVVLWAHYQAQCCFYPFCRVPVPNHNQVQNMCIILGLCLQTGPDIKVHGANMGPIWGRQDPGGPHVGPMNFAIWGYYG